MCQRFISACTKQENQSCSKQGPRSLLGSGGFTANGYSDSTQQPQNLSLGISFYGEFMATFFGRFNLTLPGSEGMGSGEAEWHPFLIYLSFGP